MSILNRHLKPATSSWDDFFPHLWREQQDMSDAIIAPKVDIVENKNSFEIKADLSGIAEKDISVTLHDGVLTLSGSHEKEEVSEDSKVIRRERYTGSFSRSFNIGKHVQESDIVADFNNGVLKLTIQKVQEKEPQARRIPISS